MSARRITDRELDAIAARLNRMTGSPLATYVREPWVNNEGTVSYRMVAQVGNFYIDHAYGGVQLCRVCNPGGGVRDVLQSGHVPKRVLYVAAFAYIEGMTRGTEPPTPARLEGVQ